MDIIEQIENILTNVKGYPSKKRKIFKLLSENNILFLPLSYLKYDFYSNNYKIYKTFSGVIFLNEKRFYILNMDYSFFYDKIFFLDNELFHKEKLNQIKNTKFKELKISNLQQKICLDIIEEK